MEMFMKRVSGTSMAVLGAGAAVTVALGASAPANADNPLGLYIGAGVGTSNVGDNNNNYYYGGYHDHDAAWKALVGIRPLPIVGAEAEYIDFGSAHGNNGYYNSYYNYDSSSHPKATVLYGLGYLPLPLPFIDVYGKLGVAHLQTDVTSNVCSTVTSGPGGLSCTPTSYRIDQSNDKFAYGAGVQAKFEDFAFRAEYERINSEYGDPSAFMVSATWTF
jgi:Outer membrane protein beta-barrel domain